ncbi:NAD(P)H-hydrate dehydratase [Nesterenkonia sp. YGD6]|uniref:NAD(P)H-hydrate dehydratase n=1 Tax=Nesterenkonia sp. YGD6 TaxID=2901231 RepID=UPI001F4CD07C|nr:NAD(P)H-hydrate dehydratase [Nesterenkonia sp. YGD6]MCH8562766.1 NAD(P)H-hydrate dehydratase [Nesterenkonia sp. YGD6]
MTASSLPLYSGTQIRAAERPLVEAGEGPALMRRAAYGLASQVLELLRSAGGIYGARVVGLIGAGNNGGDGLYALAELRSRGVDAHAVLLADRAHPQALEGFLRAGGRLREDVPADTTVLIDAILGTGARGAFVLPEVSGLTDAARTSTVVACDIPSGVDADTGRCPGDALAAQHTVTFGAAKVGLLLGQGGLLSGEIHTVDIGMDDRLPTPAAWELTGPERNAPRPRPGDHKYSRGILQVVAGSAQFPGAAELTVGAAITSGVGMVRLQAEASVSSSVLQSWPEAVMSHGRAEKAIEGATAAAIGPGLGRDRSRQVEAETMLRATVESRMPCVLDATGLELLRGDLLSAGELGAQLILTPHLGEARRMAEVLEDESLQSLLAEDPDTLEATRALARALGATVLLKGPSTVVAGPDGAAPLIVRSATPGLATAGTGDVLTGIIGALLATASSAQNLDFARIAAEGARLHAAAAQRLDPHGRGHFGASALIGALRE